MGKSVEILRENLREHPAVRAWSATAPERVEPKAIAVIKPWMKNQVFGTYKSGVYRLAGVGPSGSAVIAKRCPPQTAEVERLIYEEFLPRLPLPSVSQYGTVDEPDGQSCWLFLEEARGALYSPLDPEHRALAARWLAAVHGAGCDPQWKTRLPDRGSNQHLQMLRACRAKVLEHLSNPSLSSDGAVVLQTVAEQCDVVGAHWTELETICRIMPQTLLHGDFVIKNLRVRPAADGPQLLVFDWEYAGWGAPGTDLAQFTGGMASPDLAVYRCCLNGSTMIRDDAQVEQLANCGRLFRLVDTMFWASLGMVAGPPDFLLQPISELGIYSKRMARALSEAGWTTHDKELASVASLARSEAPAIRSTDAARQGSEDDV